MENTLIWGKCTPFISKFLERNSNLQYIHSIISKPTLYHISIISKPTLYHISNKLINHDIIN